MIKNKIHIINNIIFFLFFILHLMFQKISHAIANAGILIVKGLIQLILVKPQMIWIVKICVKTMIMVIRIVINNILSDIYLKLLKLVQCWIVCEDCFYAWFQDDIKLVAQKRYVLGVLWKQWHLVNERSRLKLLKYEENGV